MIGYKPVPKNYKRPTGRPPLPPPNEFNDTLTGRRKLHQFEPKTCFCYKMCMDANTEDCNKKCKHYEKVKQERPISPKERIVK